MGGALLAVAVAVLSTRRVREFAATRLAWCHRPETTREPPTPCHRFGAVRQTPREQVQRADVRGVQPQRQGVH